MSALHKQPIRNVHDRRCRRSTSINSLAGCCGDHVTSPPQKTSGLEAFWLFAHRRSRCFQHLVVLGETVLSPLTLRSQSGSATSILLKPRLLCASAFAGPDGITRHESHLCGSLAARNQSLSCARELHEVAFWSPEKAEARLREGQAYIKVDRARDAEQAWLATIEDDPLHRIPLNIHHDACQELLKIYAIEDRWEDAYPIIWKSYDRSPPLTIPFCCRCGYGPSSNESLTRNRPSSSNATWPQTLKIKKPCALARAEAAMGQHAEATQHFQACLKKWPNDVRAWRDYQALLLERGELDTFLALLKQPPKGADSESETWMYRGVASEKSGDWQAAAQNFHKAIEINPVVPKVLLPLVRGRIAPWSSRSCGR